MPASAHAPSEGFTHTNTGFFKEHLILKSKKTFIESTCDRSVKCHHLSSQLQMRTDRCSVQRKFYHPGTVQPIHSSYKLSRFPARPLTLLQTRAVSACASRSYAKMHKRQASLSMLAKKRWAHHSSRSIGTKSRKQGKGQCCHISDVIILKMFYVSCLDRTNGENVHQ